MGGNALKNTNCVRVNKDLYEKIKSIILEKLLPYNNFITVFEMPEKETFGDLDLLYEYKDGVNIRDIVNDIFTPKEVFSNSDLFSFSYQINETEYFQIDLIKVANINMAQFYYGYGEVSNILGRMLKRNGLTFTSDGLFTTYCDQRIILYNDPQLICNFLNLNYIEWKNGFKTKIYVFDWIIKCKYFNKECFSPETFNSEYKKKSRKRPNFVEFLEYIFNSNIKSNILNNQTVLDYITIANKQNDKDIIDQKNKIINLHQEKYNGQVFLKYTDVKNINKCKDEFKKYISQTHDFNEWLMNNNLEIINNKIKEFILNNSYHKTNTIPLFKNKK